METCLDMVFGEFDYDNIESYDASSTFYWAYMIVVTLLLLNMMMAIVMEAYSTICEESYTGEINLLLAARIPEQVLRVGDTLGLYLHGFSAWSKPSGDEAGLPALTYKKLRLDILKLPHKAAVQRKKIVPKLLWAVLSVLLDQEKKRAEILGVNADLKGTGVLTPQVLMDMFPRANVSEKQAVETIRYLLDGYRVCVAEAGASLGQEGDREKLNEGTRAA